ncbi:MAG TPA: hypothetical protein VGL19_14300 [Polyangiaceae bacterium]
MIRSTAIALLVSTWSLGSHAQSASLAGRSADSTLTQSALAAFERHDYLTALAQLRRAAVSAPSSTVGLYMARSRVALGQLVEAAEDYRGVVAGADPSQNDPLSICARDELAQLRPRIPSIDIELGDAEQRARNLRLVMDGHLVAFGTPVPVDPGIHEVVAADADGEQARLHFEISEGEAKTVAMAWLSPSGRAAKRPEQVGGASSARRTWGVVALTVGATGLGIGTVTGIAALSRYSAADQHCPAGKCTEGAPYPENQSGFYALRTISAAGYVVGGVGIGTWLGLLLTTPTKTAEHPSVSPWTPVVGMGSAGARYIF